MGILTIITVTPEGEETVKKIDMDKQDDSKSKEDRKKKRQASKKPAKSE